MNQLYRIVLIGSFIGFSWLAMQVVHELGHVLSAVASGGHVTNVVLHPCTISRTDVFPNPHPLFVAWAGSIVGTLLPLLGFLFARFFRWPGTFLFRFFAGFCLVANGAYIGIASIQGIGDAGEMLRYGSPRWQLILFGLFTATLGLFLWDGLGQKFGLGKTKETVSRSATHTALALFIILTTIELIIGSK